MKRMNLFCQVLRNGKKVLPFCLFTLLPLNMVAQDNITLDTYIGAQLATEDLNGTARYVGMGGAMDALGAEISTIGSNPAGIGLFRSNQVSTSFGLVSQQDGKSFQDGSKTHASFDQIGVVFATRYDQQSFINFGFNFHKSRDFNHVLSAAAAAVNGSAQNRQTTIKGIRGDLDRRYGESQVDNLYLESGMITDDKGNVYDVAASSYDFCRAQTGYIGEYDFNLSGNINNRVYLGFTAGIKSVHYKSYTEYAEELASLVYDEVGMKDEHKITGTGFDIKFGVIVRPIDESPFRLGLSVASPTWYKLKTENFSGIYDEYGCVREVSTNGEFRMNTPWKFGVSAGHTIGREVALGFGFEYADYSTLDMRTISGRSYDWDGYAYDDSSSDGVMKRLTENTLKGVSTLKVGVEYKPDPSVAIRAGYNYQSPMYKKEAVRDQTLSSPGTWMASTTDYTNWEATNRLTLGLGFTFDKLRLDLGYQYTMRSGNFYPYMNGVSATYVSDETGRTMELRNDCHAVSVKDNRHQLLCSLTYSF